MTDIYGAITRSRNLLHTKKGCVQLTSIKGNPWGALQQEARFTGNKIVIIIRSQNQVETLEWDHFRETDNVFIIRSHEFDKSYALTSKGACSPKLDCRLSSTSLLGSGLTNILDVIVVQCGSENLYRFISASPVFNKFVQKLVPKMLVKLRVI